MARTGDLHLTVPRAEQDLIGRVLRFANLRRVTSTTQVESIFMGATLVRAVTDTFKVLRPDEADVYRRDQGVLRDALEGIASSKASERQRWGDEADRAIRATTTLQMRGGRLTYRLDGVLAATWLAVAFLLDDDRGLTNRLGHCRKPGCGRFNLTFEGKRRIFCSDEHRLAYDKTVAKDRVKKWRDDRRLRLERERQRKGT